VGITLDCLWTTVLYEIFPIKNCKMESSLYINRITFLKAKRQYYYYYDQSAEFRILKRVNLLEKHPVY